MDLRRRMEEGDHRGRHLDHRGRNHGLDLHGLLHNYHGRRGRLGSRRRHDRHDRHEILLLEAESRSLHLGHGRDFHHRHGRDFHFRHDRDRDFHVQSPPSNNLEFGE
ncbi:histidine-rich glycoprotein-like [Colletotrichum tofieldiae]|nr:histidine-rich glycoprotein-like [Colletotrichum tofieldiae]GKT77294.1 histidine-rich glycoprotein-like [Colletotrichum tofieldiae]